MTPDEASESPGFLRYAKNYLDRALEMAPISKTTRAFFWFLGTFLLVSFLLGLVTGLQENRATIAAQVLSDLDLVYTDSRIEFRHRCGDRFTHAYDVGTGVLRKNPYPRQAPISGLVLALRENRSFLMSAAGGASGGWTLWKMKDAVLKSKKAPKKILIRVVTALSGYFAGYYLAGELDASCSSDSTDAYLRDKNAWLLLERSFLLQQLRELGFGGEEWLAGDQTFTDQMPRLAKLAGRANASQCQTVSGDAEGLLSVLYDVNYDPTKEDFELLASIRQRLSGLRVSEALLIEPCIDYSREMKMAHVRGIIVKSGNMIPERK